MGHSGSSLGLQAPPRSTRIANTLINLTPAAACLFKDQIAVGVKAPVCGEDFRYAITVKVYLIEE